MAELSFCRSDALVKLGECLWEVSKGRLTVRETCSEGKIPAVKPGNANAASLICPEPLLDFQELHKSSRMQFQIFPYMNFIALQKKKENKKPKTCLP